MATASLELINPYSKYGLKRRPTYNEIIGLIHENDTITGKLPDRTATFFKASPEGSFFDGLDHLELLKEQQNRILERQMRELLLKQNLGNRTYHTERLRQQNQEVQTPETETHSDTNIGEATMEAQLQERARQFAERQQQTQQAHQGVLSRASTPSVVRRIFENISTPELRQPMPRRISTPEGSSSGSEELLSDEMMTARTHTDDRQIKVNYSTNISSMSAEALKIQLFLRGVDVDDPENSLENLRKRAKVKDLQKSNTMQI